MQLDKKQLDSIFSTFKDSKYGEILSKQPRYAIYMPKNTGIDFWTEFLGPNGNNLAHMPGTYEQIRGLIADYPGLLDGEKQKL